jgi:zinc transporter ZupT
MFHWNSSKFVFGWMIKFSFLSLWYPSIEKEIANDLFTSFDLLHSYKMLIFMITIFVKAKNVGYKSFNVVSKDIYWDLFYIKMGLPCYK